MKDCRGDADDRIRALVDLNGAANNGGITAEIRLPEAITDHDNGSSAGLRAFDWQESSSENGMYTKSIKKIR